MDGSQTTKQEVERVNGGDHIEDLGVSSSCVGKSTESP